MTVSLQGNSEKSPDFERLRGLDEIWVFCFRRPRPGWRLFGRFIQRDHFIGLDLKDRHELAGNNTYGLYATNAIKIWNECIGREPLRSDAASGYLSGVTRDLDNDL